MVTLRAPSADATSTTTTTPSPSITPPTVQFLSGTWNVTHSTLPMWRKNKNVVITYTPIPSTSPPQLDDVVTYQPLSSSSLKTVHGVDKPITIPDGPSPDSAPADAQVASLAYIWRGKGWLMIASSKWELLGHGDEEGGSDNAYLVTYFAKTLFTPVGLDICSRKGKLKAETVDAIKAGLVALGGDVERLAGQLFEVAMDEGK